MYPRLYEKLILFTIKPQVDDVLSKNFEGEADILKISKVFSVRRNSHDAVGDEFSIVTSMWETRIDRSAAWPWPWPSLGRRPFSAPLPPPQLPKDWLGIISTGVLYVFCTRNQQISYTGVVLHDCVAAPHTIYAVNSATGRPIHALFLTNLRHKPDTDTGAHGQSQLAQIEPFCT